MRASEMLRLLALFGLLWTQACAGLPNAPVRPSDDPRFAPKKKTAVQGIPGDRPPTLVLLPGDTINVELESTTTRTLSGVLIDSTGAVHVPLAGDVKIAGLSLVAAEAQLKSALQRFDKYIHVTVAVAQLAGHQATVVGAVNSPGKVPLPPAARLADVVLLAGGPTQVTISGWTFSGADFANAEVLRDGKRLPVSVERALAGDLDHNIYIRAGDHIFIPPTHGRNIATMGQTGGGVFPWTPGLRLTTALAAAGGVTVGADKNDVRIVRGPAQSPVVYQTSLRDIVDGDAPDVVLSPGDVVWVEDHWIEDFGEVMAVLGPLIALPLSIFAVQQTIESLSSDPTVVTDPTP